MTQLQVQTLSNQELNRALAELMGYTVKELPLGHNGRQLYALVTPSGRQRIASLSIESAYLDAPFYCTDPAASLEVEKKAIEVDDVDYFTNLLTIKEVLSSPSLLDVYNAIALATSRERAEAAYMTLQAYQVDKQ
jgi:hypothetical protein